MKKFLKDDGFTLIELMVVVAIIGVLSAIAVPNFKKYQAKAKQSEAKIQLASVYSTEIAAQADYDAFGTCLADLGYDINPRGYYTVGFAAAVVAGVTARGGTCASSHTISPTTTLKAAAASAPTTLTGFTVAADYATFTAGATGNISAALTDTWSITQAKALTNSTPGL